MACVPVAGRTEEAVSSMAGESLLACTGILKAFGAVQALYNVDFEVLRGEAMGLVGDHGAGKSTLIKGITGIYPLDGEVRFEGECANPQSP